MPERRRRPCGSVSSAIALALDELAQIVEGTWVDVCKLPAEEQS